ncbi:hypothetical protein PGT21_020419 [Puccinia graminis f. sp. tritici]|uniref:Ketopantoate reductase C-terminal domain-containing protein n=1 Tax=Puccinia graminis f. sp. tritici TaxID=56615 RepID=A0A5B0QFP3_PUCGR|nr:hypothetical protein PGT21_020419 [Puccinia graminis f. sp. tritici]
MKLPNSKHQETGGVADHDDRPPPTLELIQNGIGFKDHHCQRHPKVPILSVVTIVNAEQLKPSLVRQNHWTWISIGPYLNFSSYLEHPHPQMDPQPEMVKSPQLRSHLKGCMEEIFKAATKIFKIKRFPAKFASIQRILESTERAGKQSTIKPSMLVDWELGRPLKIKAILGFPIQIAACAGVKLAWIQSMYTFLTQLQLARLQKNGLNQARI